MKDLRVSQKDLAETLGVTRGVISHYIVGRHDPSIDAFIKICQALSISSDWLLFGKLDSSPKTDISLSELKLAQAIASLPKARRRDIEGAIKVFSANENL